MAAAKEGRARARDEWPRTSDGRIAMVTERLDLDCLIAELEG